MTNIRFSYVVTNETDGMRGFSDEERDRIREQLLEEGRESLLTYGPGKTTITDITEPVGIAKSTFYRFFDTKAELYFEIYEQEARAFVERVWTELEGMDDPREELERIFWCYVEFAEENPFVQTMMVGSNYQNMFRDISSHKFAEITQETISDFLPLLEDLKTRSSGPLSTIDPLILFSLMGGSLGFMVLHRDEFEGYEEEFEGYEDGYYRHVQEVLISTLARGLTVEE
jgi:AcrR family transcriptional regulator